MNKFQLWRDSELLLAGCESIETPKREALKDSYNECQRGKEPTYYIRGAMGTMAIGKIKNKRMRWIKVEAK